MLRKLTLTAVAALTLAGALSISSTAQAASRVTATSGTSTSTRRADAVRYQHERDELDQIRAKSFPRLSKYDVIGSATPKYNCIAWSLGVTSRWVWPGTSLASFDDLNAQYGYRRMSRMDFSLEAGVEKVVLYGKMVDGKFEATHQARQNPDGTWTSKLGKMALIRHASPDSLDGPDYGKPYAVYYRKKTDRVG
jgi:hypothetical protein